MEATATEAQRAAPPPRLRERYQTEVVQQLTSRFGYGNPMEVPRLKKVTVTQSFNSSFSAAHTQQISGSRASFRHC